MTEEARVVTYDEELRIEAYRFSGVAQSFPSHFHEYYVLGLMEAGQRSLTCRDGVYTLGPGDMLLLNPSDSHACVQCSGGTLSYRGVNFSPAVMEELAEEVTGERRPPRFSPPVIHDDEAVRRYRALHTAVMEGAQGLEKEESLLLLLTLLLRRYSQPFAEDAAVCRNDIRQVCRFIETHYAQRITLAQLCRCAGRSKSALLRDFTREKGVTPYRYLVNIRIGAARKLLEQGKTPMDAALRTGFSDQSHFTNYFKHFIGLTPAAYREIFRERR